MAASFPKGRTAFLVIHGIGEQNPFETLDSFGRGMIDHLKSQGIDFSAEHCLAGRRDDGKESWTESYVRLKPSVGDGFIDIHEYYWAYLTEEQISVPEVWEWVERTLEGTRAFYDENEELRRRYEKNGKVSFKLESVAWQLRKISFVYPILKLLIDTLTYTIPSWARGIGSWLKKKGEYIIKGYIGDVAIYTTMDEKSRFFDIRRRILAHSLSLLESLITDPQYDRIVIAGHSLGSVISYDTLNRLNIKASMDGEGMPLVDKIKGLVTFGSPLDKIAFFFREHARKEQYLRRQIMEHLHSFKAKPLSFHGNKMDLINPVRPLLDQVEWVNYYNDNDPVSGHLDFYNVDENIKLELPGPWGIAHGQYWKDERFYGEITERFLT